MWLLASVGVALALPVAVRDAMAVKDCDTVLAALPSPATDEERLAAGWCREAMGDGAGAAEVLAPVTDERFVAWARWTRAEALVDAGRHDEALWVVEGLALPGDYALRTRLLAGRARVEAGRSLEAREDLRALLDTSAAVEARVWLAQGGEDRGERDAAVATWRRVWAEDGRGPWADRAAEALARLGAPVPDYATKEGRDLVRERVVALGRAQDHEQARALAEPLHEAAPAEAATGAALGRLRFKAKDYPGAVAAWRESLGAPAVAAGSAQDVFDYALATSRTGDYDTAAVIYGRVVAGHPGTKQADFASFKIGYLEVDRGRCDDARRELAAHVERMPDSAHLDEALWFAGRCAWKSGDLPAAEAAWDRLIRERPSSGLVPAALYWKARARGRAGDAAAEATGLADVLRRYPVSAYAWFAAERLGRKLPARATQVAPTLPADLAARPGMRRATALIEAGFPAWARAELAAEPVPTGAEGRLGYAHVLLRAGDVIGARRLVEGSCPKPWAEGDAALAAVCLPRPEVSIVDAISARYGLDPRLPPAIMTAESGFDPSVTSPAGARGLMQIMPAEAPRVHADLYGDDDADLARLYESPYNASLGTALLGMEQRALGDLLDGNDLPATIAAYNGGPDAVRRWVGDGRPEPDEFAEDIGYTETRQYVKRVLGYLMAYRWTYGD